MKIIGLAYNRVWPSSPFPKRTMLSEAPADGRPALETASREHLAGVMRRLAGRDRAAFAELYQATSAKLLGVVLRIVRERAWAEDILHEVFIKVWERANDYDPDRGSPLAWIIIMARNKALDEVRSRARLKSSHAVTEVDDIPADSEHPLDHRMQQEDHALLMRCLEKLEQSRKEMILLAYQNGLSREDLAQRFSAPVATIKTWLRRGLENLRLCLSAHG